MVGVTVVVWGDGSGRSVPRFLWVPRTVVPGVSGGATGRRGSRGGIREDVREGRRRSCRAHSERAWVSVGPGDGSVLGESRHGKSRDSFRLVTSVSVETPSVPFSSRK